MTNEDFKEGIQLTGTAAAYLHQDIISWEQYCEIVRLCFVPWLEFASLDELVDFLRNISAPACHELVVFMAQSDHPKAKALLERIPDLVQATRLKPDFYSALRN